MVIAFSASGFASQNDVGKEAQWLLHTWLRSFLLR